MATYDLPKCTLDDVARRVILKSGFTTINVQVDLYSDWKEAARLNPALIGNNKLFRTFGGDSLGAPKSAGAYYMLQNQAGADWRIRPAEANQTTVIEGNIFGEDPLLPIDVDTLGAFTSRLRYDTSQLTQVVTTATALPTGTVVANGSNTASTFQTDLTQTINNHWKDVLIKFTSGALKDQVKKISLYNGTTKFITVSEPFTSAPLSSSTFRLVNE